MDWENVYASPPPHIHLQECMLVEHSLLSKGQCSGLVQSPLLSQWFEHVWLGSCPCVKMLWCTETRLHCSGGKFGTLSCASEPYRVKQRLSTDQRTFSAIHWSALLQRQYDHPELVHTESKSGALSTGYVHRSVLNAMIITSHMLVVCVYAYHI